MNNLFIIFILLIEYVYSTEYTYFDIPPPNVDPSFCNRKSKNSFICNPDNIISDEMADNFDKVADKLVNVGPNVMCWINMRNVINKDGDNDPFNFTKNLAIEWSNFGYRFDIVTVVSINDKYLDIFSYNKESGSIFKNDISNLKIKLQNKVNNEKYDEAVQEYINYISDSNDLNAFQYVFLVMIGCIIGCIICCILCSLLFCILIFSGIYYINRCYRLYSI